MELRTLQYFLTVAREENITRASEVLHITQPTLSRQMKQLEQELGTELFVRRGHPLAEQESVTCADLLSVTLITPARLYVQKEISNWLGADINKLNVLATVNMMTHAAMFINSGAACGLTIEGAVDLFEDSKMVFKPLNPRLELTAVLAWKRFHSLSGAAAKFLEYLRSILKVNSKKTGQLKTVLFLLFSIILFVGNFFQPRYVFAIYFIKNYTKNAPYKIVQCVKRAYQSVFFKYNFAVFKGFYARQRFKMVTGFNNALMARLEGFFDYNADACNLAACLVGNIGKAERRFAVCQKVVNNKHGFAFVQEFFEDAYIAGNFFGEAVNFGGVGRAAHKFRFLLTGKNYRYMQAQCGC